MTINEFIREAILDIARKDYRGTRYNPKWEQIPDTFQRHIYTDDVGAIVDCSEHKVWIVYKDEGHFRYRSVA